jgi:hypothetical protein
MTPHCKVILGYSVRIPIEQGLQKQTDMFIVAEAEDVLPNNKNQGLKPSDDCLLMMRMCCHEVQHQALLKVLRHTCGR